jgi:hypothetical protein
MRVNGCHNRESACPPEPVDSVDGYCRSPAADANRPRADTFAVEVKAINPSHVLLSENNAADAGLMKGLLTEAKDAAFWVDLGDHALGAGLLTPLLCASATLPNRR